MTTKAGALRSRNKGSAWERQVCAKLRKVGYEAKRRLDRRGPSLHGDRDLEIDAPLCIQCKQGFSPSVWKALEQATRAADPLEYSVAIVRRNNAKQFDANVTPTDLAVLPLEDFLELLQMLRKERIL